MSDQTFLKAARGTATVFMIAPFRAEMNRGQLYGRVSREGRTPSLQGSTYLDFTIDRKPVTGRPRFTPAEFTFPRGEAIITNNESLMARTGGASRVVRTPGNVETVNEVVMAVVSNSNAASTFTIPRLGPNVVSPGLSVATATIWFNQTNSCSCFCEASCGSGPDPYASLPLGAPGNVTGTLTVM